MAASKYESHVAPYLDKIADWAARGAALPEIADKLGIGLSTLKKYLALGKQGKTPYVDFVDCFARACEEPDDNVEAAMYKRACGIEYEEKTYEAVLNKETGEIEERCTKRVTKFIPPDPTSAMFWLANRRPNKWRYKPEPSDGDDENSATGVVELPPVMAKPAPPGEGDADG